MNAKPRKQSILTTTRPRTNAERLMLWRRRMDDATLLADAKAQIVKMQANLKVISVELGRLACLVLIWAGMVAGFVWAASFFASTVHH